MKKILATLICILPLLSIAQVPIAHYKIYDVKKQKLIQLEEILSNMKNVDVLFFGEEHNDAIAHQLELELYQKMSSSFPKTVLSLEMFHNDVQPVMDEYLLGLISEKNFVKEARVWKNYDDYKPMIEYAKAYHLPVIAANAATRYSNAVSKSGLSILDQFPKNSSPFLPPLPVDTATGKYYEKFIAMLGGHGMGTMKIYQTQNLWDATMSWSIAKYLKSNKGTKVFQVNGRFHSDEKLGTLAKLKTLLPKLKIANISCFSGEDFISPDWEKYSSLGDYILLTDPAVKRTF
ncbi:ChaN family lipoprotein [Pedobacter sp. N36a]|uniref:ChaN family lipoprotein n=1 Tax=Pedobacter sp. N36a TaxID=2767996 RepID=UPI001657618E|nr:ChaN family lipoprotein [Pedobacter sp. N36a]MBC8984520.1 ChaN family lipoprotein [Pedobacter sp. N36a]